MTVRLFLMTADCWRCDVSISVHWLLREQASRRGPSSHQTVSSQRKRVAASRTEIGRRQPARVDRPTGRLTAAPQPGSAVPDSSSLRPAMSTTSAADADRSAEMPPQFVAPRQRSWRSFLQELLACLLSIVVHLLLLILLALLSFGFDQERPPQIQLSLIVDPRRVEGGIVTEPAVIQPTGFELPVEDPPEPEELSAEADLWARELEAGPRETTPNLPPLARVMEELQSDNLYRRMLSARDPRIRTEVILQEGGTSRTEAAVARALRWISWHQRENGSWPLDAFHFADSCRGQCGNAGRIRSAAGGTALALQAMLGAGQTHETGMYREAVGRGLDYLVRIQTASGDLRGDTATNAGMYVQALATIALCDALAMTGDSRLREAAQAAVDFIVMSQHRAGGWRYEPTQRGDTSVVGWQLMALHSARAAGLAVSTEALLGASQYLDTAQTDDTGAFYAYRPGGRPTPAMTAEGLLSRMYLGWQKGDPGLRAGVLALATEFPPDPEEPNIYYWYYATQVMHHWGGRPWREWNRKMRDVLVDSQITAGHEAGSWDPITPHGHQGGRLYMTALACCTLEVYYRHAPIFRKIDLE